MGIYTVLAILMAYSAYRYGKRSERQRPIWMRLLLTLFLIFLVSFVTLKYYEVPVHKNKFIVENINQSPISYGTYDVTITYDYNNSPAMKNSPNYKKELCGLNEELYIWFNDSVQYVFNNGYQSDSIKLDARVMADNTLYETGESFDLDKVKHLVRTKLETSNRQFLYPFIVNNVRVYKGVVNDSINLIFGKEPNSLRQLVKFSYLTMDGINISGRNHNGCVRESYILLDNHSNLFNKQNFLQREDYNYPNAIITGEDISSTIEHFELSFSNIPDSLFHKLKFEYQAPIEVDGLPFEPDSITMTSIVFNEPEKLAYIAKKGLVFHVSFPDMKNTQIVRTFIATGILGWLIGMMCTLLGTLTRGTMTKLYNTKSWKELIKVFVSMFKSLFIQPIKDLKILFFNGKNGHKYIYYYWHSHPFMFIFLVLILIAIIMLTMTIIFSNINPFDPSGGFDFNIKNRYRTIYL